MEAFFENSPIFIFFFAMIAIYNYSDLNIEQRLSIMYISVYALVVTKVIGLKLAVLFLFITMFCYLEIFTTDLMKQKLLANPMYKIVDCIYLSVAQYYLLYIILSIGCLYYRFDEWIGKNTFGIKILKLLSVVFLVIGIIKLLRQKYTLYSFDDMYQVFVEFPIYKVNFNNKRLREACKILISIEDRNYFKRESYTFVSLGYIFSVMVSKFKSNSIAEVCKKTKIFLSNIITLKRGYSTIPMQLIRSLGIKSGYNCTIRRKIYEILYSRMFFDGIKHLLEDEYVAKRKYFKFYLLYIYFHVVQTFLGDAAFSKFLNAFDMKFSEKNEKDIFQCTNEGIFIACMGLSKRATKINKNNIDYYLKGIPVQLNRDEILDMVNNMMKRPYNGNYLK